LLYFPKIHLVNPEPDEDEIKLEEDTEYNDNNDNNDNDDEIA
jgi:hypothetical protein